MYSEEAGTQILQQQDSLTDYNPLQSTQQDLPDQDQQQDRQQDQQQDQQQVQDQQQDSAESVRPSEPRLQAFTLLEVSRTLWIPSEVRNEACQRRLLSGNELPFAKAFEISLNMETTDRDVRQLRGMENDSGRAARFQQVIKQGNKNGFTCKLNNHNARADVTLEMEVDTVSSSVVSQRTYEEEFSHLSLQKAQFSLKAYNGGQIPELGHITTQVVYEGKTLFIVTEYGSTPWQKWATQEAAIVAKDTVVCGFQKENMEWCLCVWRGWGCRELEVFYRSYEELGRLESSMRRRR
ncbi:hypothetical protein KUCAC02_002676 [Chaenocephalus aceratus]|uniref:Uncharacterized protein n=1 Tax=Chaenocephalus aceratus TaxID=36190 RepID=A0ACB9XWI4_CHAAC|nr:hypothetical protein KUCAC02_002676 [Chaenocephalus aceratus]